MDTLQVTASAFLALLPITNPLGAVAVFAVLGSVVLEAFGITIPALQIAGGLVVAHAGSRRHEHRLPSGLRWSESPSQRSRMSPDSKTNDVSVGAAPVLSRRT